MTFVGILYGVAIVLIGIPVVAFVLYLFTRVVGRAWFRTRIEMWDRFKTKGK